MTSNLENQNTISHSTIVRTYCMRPASGGFGEWTVNPDASEIAEFGAHFGDMEVIHADEFNRVGIVDIRGSIHGEAGRCELYAYKDRGEWEYTLVERVDLAAWAQDQIEDIEPTQDAVRRFDSGPLGDLYKEATGVTMWENLGGDTLP